MDYINSRKIRYSLLIIIAALFCGCSSAPELINLGVAKNEVKSYYESGQYNKEALDVVTDAIKDFDKVDVKDSSAVVFDIDETVLSNYPHIKSVDFGFISDLWNKWILEARAPAIVEVRNMYNYLVKRKFHILFISGRTRAQYEATMKNLKSEGYAKFDTLIVRPDNMKDAPAENFKSIERIVLTNMGYKIEGCVGDQWSDLMGEYTGIKIKLPDYLYLIK